MKTIHSHITTVCSQVLNYTAELTVATWSEQNCQNFENVARGFEPGLSHVNANEPDSRWSKSSEEGAEHKHSETLPERQPILFLQVLQAVLELLTQAPGVLVVVQVSLHFLCQRKLRQLHVKMFTIIPETAATTLVSRSRPGEWQWPITRCVWDGAGQNEDFLTPFLDQYINNLRQI